MKKVNKIQSLIICLIAEIVVFVLGTVFVHPLPIEDLNDRLMAFALFEFSCIMGIVAASIYGLLDEKRDPNTDPFEMIIASLLVGAIIPIWHIALLFVAIFTLILIILEKRKLSDL